MEFGSSYVYMYDEVGYESISEEEYSDGMQISSGSDSDDDLALLESNTETLASVNATDERSAPPPGGGVDQDEGDCVSGAVLNALPPPPPPPRLPVSRGSAGRQGRHVRVKKKAHWKLDKDEGDCVSGTVLNAIPPPPPPRLPASRGSAGRQGRHARVKKKAHWKLGAPSGGERQENSRGGQKVRSGDTNIVSIKFNQLIAPSNMHAGDPQYCSGCGAILSKISKLEMKGEEKVWSCEFCSVTTEVDVEDEEVPTEEDVTFMLEPALSTQASGPSGLDESLVVFCLDVSGSMCVTTEVPGHIQLRGAESLRRARMFNRERGDQYLPSQRRDVTYISRLQSVQAAIDHQLQEMEKEFPNRKVALITFSNEVTIIGDGKVDPVVLVGDKLGSKEALKAAASEFTLPEPIKTSRNALGKKLFELEECGPTALGPALLVASTLAARVRGSKVILCTDGLANVGMGKLDNFKSEGEEEASLIFYDEISNRAADDGVAISVITIKGTDCKLVEIGKLADKTGGQVNIVDPLKLTQEFSTILANKIIATNVTATFILHKQLFFFYEESEDSKVVKKIGNVTADTEITFEYGVRTNKKDAKQNDKPKTDAQAKDKPMETAEQGLDEPDKQPAQNDKPGSSSDVGASGSRQENEHKELPFQLQIVYTDTEGAKALRVLTRVKPVTKDRQKAEKMAKLDVLATHTAQTSAQMALDGQYTMSRQRALMNQRVAWRHTRGSDNADESKKEYRSKFGKIRSMENYLNVRQKSERNTIGRTYSDESDDEDDMLDRVDEAPRAMAMAVKPSSTEGRSKTKSFLSKLKKKRSETTEDDGAKLVFRGKVAKKFFEEDD